MLRNDGVTRNETDPRDRPIFLRLISSNNQCFSRLISFLPFCFRFRFPRQYVEYGKVSDRKPEKWHERVDICRVA